MTITDRTAAPTRPVKDPLRRTALVAGTLYLVTFVTSVPTLVLYGPVHGTDFILGAGPDTGVLWGALLEVILALSGVGTAVALYPVVRRQHEGLALGFVTVRVLEGAGILVGVMSLLTVVTLRQDLAGATGTDAGALATSGAALVAFHDWSFVLSQSLMPSVSALLLGSLMFRSGLVPRIIPLVGLIGAPLLFASVTATIFGAYDQTSTIALFAGLPVALWEFSLGTWMVVKGFRPSPITAAMTASASRSTDPVTA
jgi:hypothetical protein